MVHACVVGWCFQGLLDAGSGKEIRFVRSGFAGGFFLVVLVDIWGE